MKCRILTFVASALAILATAFPVCVGGGYGADLNLARMNVTTVGGGAAPAGGPDAWYQSASDGSLTSNALLNNETVWGGAVTVTTGGSITKIGYRRHSNSSTSDVKCGLYYNNAGTWTLHGCVTIAAGANATDWRDGDLASPYTATNGQVVRVEGSADTGIGVMYTGSTGGFADYSSAYANMCYATFRSSYDDAIPGVRVYVD